MIIIEIDLRVQPRGCKEHPLVRLEKKVKELSEGEKLKVILDANTIPLSAVKIIARRAKLKMSVLRENPPIYEVLLEK